MAGVDRWSNAGSVDAGSVTLQLGRRHMLTIADALVWNCRGRPSGAIERASARTYPSGRLRVAKP